MNTSEQFIELVHDNLNHHKVEGLVKRRPFNDNPFENGMNEHDEKQHNGSFGFLSTMVKGLFHSIEHIDSDDKQFILTGMPSAGKTTELKRIAGKVVSSQDKQEDVILHLCCLQNTSSIQRAILSKDDLWNWILKSHESRQIADQRYSLDEFVELHEKFSLKPIMLIDTVDLLIYGKIGEKNSAIIRYWNEIIEELRNANFTVLWSCRQLEFKQMKHQYQTLDKTLREIPLPSLDENQVSSVFQSTKSLGKFTNKYFTTLGLAFPIIVGSKMDSRKWSPRIENKFSELHEKTKSYTLSSFDVAENAGPVKWISKALDGKIATDFLYDGLVHKLKTHVQRLYQFDTENIEQSWEKIELAFFNSAVADPNISRIQVEADVINDLSHKEHVIALVLNAKKFGIIVQNKYESPFEMSHQLFAEYCIWKHREQNPTHSEWLHKYPSCLFRGHLKSIENDTVLNEGQRWFYPFTLFNDDLARKFVNGELIMSEWEKVGSIAARFLQINMSGSDSGIARLDAGAEEIRNINKEKMNVLNNVNTKNPLIVNGPPGVGKSHLSYVWIDKKATRDPNWSALKKDEVRTAYPDGISKDKAYFMTLSQKLRMQMTDKVKQYYQNCPMPVDFESWSIPEYILQLEEVLGLNYVPFGFEEFKRAWDKEHGGDGNLTQAGRVGVQALWNEFENKMIDKFGERIDPETYAESAELFAYSTNPKSTTKAFAKWAYDVGGRKQKSLSERAGACIQKVLKWSANSGTLAQKEELLSLQPNILVLDEIQDLPFQVILLMLIMQNGTRDCVMMCGDDEQTLELVQFDWNTIFTKISTAIYEISEMEEFSEDENIRAIVEKWGNYSIHNSTLLKTIVENERVNLLSVERCVPEIVDFMKDSWKTSVSREIDKFTEDERNRHGTAYIQAGAISKGRAKRNQEIKIETGVNFYPNVTEIELIHAASEIYYNGLDIAILLPNEEHHQKFSEELKEKGIKLDVWTPRLIKGLEYPIVIATNPWDITDKHFQNVVSRSELNTWDETETYYVNKSLQLENMKRTDTTQITRTIEAISLISKQRKRHANIMLSRAQNQLIVAQQPIPDKSQMFRTRSPEHSKTYEMQDKFPTEFVKGDNIKDLNHGINKLINRLCLIILSADSEDDRRQISLKAGHIMQTLKTSEKTHLSLPFYLLERHHEMEENLGRVNLFSGGLDEFKRCIGADNFGLKEGVSGIKPGELKQYSVFLDLEKYLDDVRSTARHEKGSLLALPINTVRSYQNELNTYINRFSRVEDECFETENSELTQDMKKNVRIISEYIKTRIFGGYYSTKYEESAWIEHAQKINLHSYEVELNLAESHNSRFKLIPQNTTQNLLLSSFPESMKDEFWKEGIQLLNNGKITLAESKAIANYLSDKLNSSKNILPNQGVLFLNKLITRLGRSWTQDEIGRFSRTEDLCKYCETLEQNKGDVHTPNLFEMLNKRDRKSIAQDLLRYLDRPTISQSLLIDSNGLYQIFSEYCFKQKGAKAKHLENLLKFGEQMASHLQKQNLSDNGQTVWENKQIKQIKKYCLQVIQNTEFAKTFNPNKDEYSFSDLFGSSSDGFGQSLRSDLNKVGKQNVIEFFISRICGDELKDVLDGFGASETKLRQGLKKLPFSGKPDSNSWVEAMKDKQFASKLVMIPYNSDEGARLKLLNLDKDIYFGRTPKTFVKQSKWNRILIKILNELKIPNQLKIANETFETESFSIFDPIFIKHELRSKKNLKNEIFRNLFNESWRKSMKKNEIIRTDKGAPREETKGILPHLFLAETIELLDQIIYFFKRMSAKVQSTLTELRMEHKQLLRSNTRQQKQMGMIERQIEELYRAEGFVFAESEEVKYQKSKKQLELEKQISLAEGALSELYFKRLPRLLPDFIRYFHGEKKGKKNVAKKKNWKGLQADFLKENYPNTYQTFKQDSDLTEFSLTSWEYDNEMTLIKFLQSFGQEHPIGIKPGFTDSFDLEKYPVLRTDYTQSVDRHGRTLDEVQGASFKIPSLKELMGIKYE
jgi:hypothetical protein